MKNIIFFFGLFLLLQNQSYSQENVTISGKLLNNKYSKIFLKRVITQTIIDSAAIDQKNEFMINTIIDTTDYYQLMFDDETYVLLVLKPDEDMCVDVDLEDTYDPQISGSPNSELIYSTVNSIKSFDAKIEDMKKAIEKEKNEHIKKIVMENAESLATVFFLDQFDIENDYELYELIAKKLIAVYPENQLVLDLNQKVKNTNVLRIGSLAPEITLPDTSGTSISLSSLRGKIVLIDFWASWCKPCRIENPNLVKLYTEYSHKGFEILGVSLDKQNEAWVSAIKVDNLTWLHVSDLAGWHSTSGQEYGVEGIPYSILIDKEGKIIAKGLRGVELEKKLKEIFK